MKLGSLGAISMNFGPVGYLSEKRYKWQVLPTHLSQKSEQNYFKKCPEPVLNFKIIIIVKLLFKSILSVHSHLTVHDHTLTHFFTILPPCAFFKVYELYSGCIFPILSVKDDYSTLIQSKWALSRKQTRYNQVQHIRKYYWIIFVQHGIRLIIIPPMS